MKRSAAQGFASVWILIAGACGGEAPVAEAPITENAGECADAYGGQVCTWSRSQGDALLEVGVTVPMASIENAPAEVPMTWPPVATSTVGMPGTAGGLSHVTFGWEPMGHGPATYLTPHFDVHFYRIPNDRRMAIDCTDLSKPATLPASYGMMDEVLPAEVAAMIGTETLVGLCVPQMGMHALITEDMERTTPFESTMIVGYYETEPIFLEPMISKERLLRRQSFDLPVPTVPEWAASHPSAFRAEYVADQDAYRFVFSGFPTAS